jgi:hypothetical protein
MVVVHTCIWANWSPLGCRNYELSLPPHTWVHVVPATCLNYKELRLTLHRIILMNVDVCNYFKRLNWTWHLYCTVCTRTEQGCGSGLIYYGSGSSIFAQSGSKLKQNFRRQFLSQIFLKSKFESNQIKNTCVIHQNFFQKVLSAILYFFSGKIFLKNN